MLSQGQSVRITFLLDAIERESHPPTRSSKLRRRSRMGRMQTTNMSLTTGYRDREVEVVYGHREGACANRDNFDDEMDTVLEAQRLADARAPRPDPMESPKRKREVLSDGEHLLRKERTDGLFEGYRRVRASMVSPSRRLSSQDEYQPGIEEIEEKGEQLKKEGSLEDEPAPLPDDFEPPPPIHGSGDDDPDSEDDPEVIVVREALAGLRIEDGTCNEEKGNTTRIVLTIRQLRRVMAAKESLFKFGTFVPRSEREVDASPEAPRWRAGRDLE